MSALSVNDDSNWDEVYRQWNDLNTQDGFNSDGSTFTVPAAEDLKHVATLLMEQGHGKEKQVAADNAPHTRTISFKPTTSSDAKANKLYSALNDMSSVMALYAAVWSVNKARTRGRTATHNVTDQDEAVTAFKDLADSVYQAVTVALPGFYETASAPTKTFSKQVTEATVLRILFDEVLFNDFDLPPPAYAQLDKIFKAFVKMLSQIEVKTDSTSAQICQTLPMHFVKKDDATNSYVPIKRILYMQIDAHSWHGLMKGDEASDGGSEFTLNVGYTVADAVLNVDTYAKHKDAFDELLKAMVGVDVSTFAQAITIPVEGGTPK